MNKKIIWWILIIIWCAFIFYQSSKPAIDSSNSSLKVVQIVNSYAEKVFGPDKLVVSDKFIRKTAHFMGYLILGLLLFNGFSNKKKLLQTFGISFSVGFLYAVTDEIHQYFVPGRAMMMFDVFIDSAGVFVGVYSLYLKAKVKVYIINRWK